MPHSSFVSACRLVPLYATVMLAACPAQAADVRDLSGTWRFALDRSDEGIAARWYAGAMQNRLADRIADALD